MKLPLVSVVMPTLNSERFIGETLLSLVDQMNQRFELIVVDGGSTDNTLTIVEDFSEEDIKIIELAPGLGIAKALNVGIAAAEGRFIGRMDADDIAYKWRLHDQVYFLLTHPEIDLVGTGADAFWEREGIFRSPPKQRAILDEYLVNNPFFHPTVMFRRKIAERGLYRYEESYAFEEDYELWGRLLPQIECANMDQSSIKYRIRSNTSQWDPRKYYYKRGALAGFCKQMGIKDEVLIDGLAEFQCSAYIRRPHYEAMRAYAETAKERNMPLLGWLQNALVTEPDYASFTRWFRAAKGWAA